MSSASRGSSAPKQPFPKWLADPFCCLHKAQEPTLAAHLTPCAVQTQRNEANVRATRVTHTKERDGDWYRFGHVGARRDKEGIHLVVASSPQRSTESPALAPQNAQHAADCLRAAIANTQDKACGGKSIKEILEEELDTVVERIMTGQDAEDGRDPGRAEGVAYALAVFQNPYRPNIESVREEAMDRWYEENPDDR